MKIYEKNYLLLIGPVIIVKELNSSLLFYLLNFFHLSKNDPYAALRYREFNIFLLVRFAVVFAWSMQFVVIEWEVYSLTKDPLSLGIIGLMEVIPAVSLALFAGHVVDQKEKKSLLIKCILGFSVISLGCFLSHGP